MNIKKLVVYNWAGDKKIHQVMEALGVSQNEEIQLNNGNSFDPFAIAKDFFERGINVMLVKSDDPEAAILYLDSKAFTQR